MNDSTNIIPLKNNVQILNIGGVDCYEKDGTAYLSLEAVAWGLGFTKVETKNGKEYASVRWERVEQYLSELGFAHKWAKGDFIPENIFYRLAMKAKNEAAEQFQAKIADEVIPSIRKTGGYIAGQETMSDEELIARALVVAQRTIAQREARIAALSAENEIMQPKAEYFDVLVERNTLTTFRETAKELGAKPKAFVNFLLEKKYVFRDQKGKLMPYEAKNDGLFEVKECASDRNNWSGVQTLITPKGRETFRLIYSA